MAQHAHIGDLVEVVTACAWTGDTGIIVALGHVRGVVDVRLGHGIVSFHVSELRLTQPRLF